MKKKSLPSKIFNRIGSIPFNSVIYVTKKGGEINFIGNRSKRFRKEVAIYTIQNNKNVKLADIKGIEKEELENLWKLLIKNKVILTSDIKCFYPELANEGLCCMSAFYGMINYLFPGYFSKGHGKIILSK